MDMWLLNWDLFFGSGKNGSKITKYGSFAGLNKGHVVTKKELPLHPSDRKGDFIARESCSLRVVLSLTSVREGLRGHIVVEMSDLDNKPLVKLVGGELIETVVAHDVIGHLMIQYALQSSLAQVLEALLAPGSELWMFNEVPEKEREKKLVDSGLDVSELRNIKHVHREGNAVIRRY